MKRPGFSARSATSGSIVLLTVVLAAGAVVRAAESLTITPIVRDKTVVVSFELGDAYSEAIREAIASGLRTTFTYEVELRTVVPAWLDRTIATTVVSASDQYDNLTRMHHLSRTVDGRTEETTVTADEEVVRAWLTHWSRLALCDTGKLDQTREYYVRVSARARPRSASLVGWASAVTGRAIFTFIP